MRSIVLGAALVALALPGSAAAVAPVIPSGSALGEGTPLKAYATVSPSVHLFGDPVTASLAVVADTRWVDPAALHVRTVFRPYTAVRPPSVRSVRVGRFAQVTWTWTLRCLSSPCVPRQPPSERYHVFRFGAIHVDYRPRGRTAGYGITATWPKIEVQSQVSPGVVAFLTRTKHLKWQFHITPVAAPTYRASPALLFWLALGGSLVALLAAAGLAARWYRVVRPRGATADGAGPAGSTLERALAVLEWAHARGDETLERKALERVAGEIVVETPVAEVDELSRTARELAWSPRTPDDGEVETFSERARESGRQSDREETVE